MDDNHPLILRPNKTSTFISALFLSTALIFIPGWIAIQGIIQNQNYALAAVSLTIIVLVGIPLVILPLLKLNFGVGTLKLTPSGLTITLKNGIHSFSWSEIDHFYMQSHSFRFHTVWYLKMRLLQVKELPIPQQLKWWQKEYYVLGEKKSTTFKDIIITSQSYGKLSTEELCNLLNDWKEKYAPISPATPAKRYKNILKLPPGIWPVIFMIVGLTWYYFFSSVTFVLENQSGQTIIVEEIETVPDYSEPHDRQYFKIPPLKHGESAEVKVPRFDHGNLFLKYKNDKNQAFSFGFNKQTCTWESGDKFIFLPHGMETKISHYCYVRRRGSVKDRVIILPLNEISISEQKKYEDENNQWSNYRDLLGKKMKQHWLPPKQKYSKKVIVKFHIDKQGHLTGTPQILHTSHNPELDQSALNAVKAADPFPPLPNNAPQKGIPIEYTFDYKIR